MLNVRFLIDLEAGHPVSEQELGAPTPDGLAELLLAYCGKPLHGSLILDGSISVVHNGREILDRKYWFEFIALFNGLRPLVCQQSSWRYHFGQQQFGIVISPSRSGCGATIRMRRAPGVG
jgi:hypothetical protein